MSIKLPDSGGVSRPTTPLTWGNFCSKFSLEPLSKELTTFHKIAAVVLLIFLNLATCFLFSAFTCYKRGQRERPLETSASLPSGSRSDGGQASAPLAASGVVASEVAASEVAASEVAASEVAASEVAASEVAASEVAASEVAASGVVDSGVVDSGVVDSGVGGLVAACGAGSDIEGDPKSFFDRMSNVVSADGYMDYHDRDLFHAASTTCGEGDPKKGVMDMIGLAVDRNRCTTRRKVDEAPEIISPSVALLEKVAQYYGKKYDVHIQVVLHSDLDRVLNEIESKKGSYGLVVIQDQSMGHVVPLLINCVDCTKQVIKLDVLSADVCNLREISQIIMDLLDEKGYQIFVTQDARQADHHSCRTESLGILRNMLLYVKEKNICDFRGFNSPRVNELLFDPTLIYRYERGGCRRPIAFTQILLPGECDYMDQITRKDLGDLKGVFVIRTKYSKQEEKRGSEESVADFRRRYEVEVHNRTEYIISRDISFGEDTKEGVILSNTSSDGNVTTIVSRRDQTTAVITILRKITICAHQNLKGYRNVLRHVGPFVELPHSLQTSFS